MKTVCEKGTFPTTRAILGLLIWVFVGVLAVSCSRIGEERVFYTRKRVATARENLNRYAWARTVFDSLRARAKEALSLPDTALRDWISELTPTRAVDCPLCGASWRGYIWKWSSKDPEVLYCRRCGGRVVPADFPANDSLLVRDPQGVTHVLPVYRDSAGHAFQLWERLAYQRLVHVSRWLEALGAVYAVEPSSQVARVAKTLLLRVAQVYPGYALHDWYHYGTRPWPLAGKISGWNYEDAVFLVKCGKAYDAVSRDPVWSSAERDSVKTGLFRCAARFLTALRPDQGIVNDIPFRFAGVAWAGRILHDSHIMRWVLDDEFGIEPFIRCHWFPDGTWNERSPSYDLMALRNFHEAVEAVEGYSDPPGLRAKQHHKNVRLLKIRRLRQIYEQPFRITYPDGTLPPINDSHAGQKPPALLADVDLAWYGSEQALLNLAKALGDSGLSSGGVYALFHRPPDAPQKVRRLLRKARSLRRPSFRSDYLGLLGIRGRAYGREAMVTLQYGGIHGGHDHYDKLDLTLFACGREMLSDLGYVYWSHPERFVWTRRSLAHNTVTVDGINQSLSGGECVLFRDEGWVQMAEAEAPGVYALVTPTFSRQLIWVEKQDRAYVVDVFRVRGGQFRDWSVHAETDQLKIENVTLHPTEGLPGCDYAYEQLSRVRSAQFGAPLLAEWRWGVAPVARLRLHLLAPGSGTLYLAQAPAERHPGEEGRTLPYLIVRQSQGAGATFVAVWEPCADSLAPLSTSLTRCAADGDAWPVSVSVRFPDGAVDIVCSALSDDPDEVVAGGDEQLRWRGRIGVVRFAGGEVEKSVWVKAYAP